ncbi:MAG TPA: hypothetical protein VJT73_16875 [Polyangiaceae bacterium]|nr:hypothetical protein [Polyangiaceae bacterium]
MLKKLASSQWFVYLAVPLALAVACSTKSGPPDPASTTGASGAAGSGGASAGLAGVSIISDASAEASGEHGRDTNDAGSDVPIVAAFAEEARRIAANYQSWGRVDDEWRWAPFLCRLPLPAVARPSQSDDPSTHGQKLYSVFAKNHAAYPAGPHTDQAVVKESWVPEVVTEPDANYNPGSYRTSADAGARSADADHFYGYAKGEGGVVYRAATPAGLFIMFKLAPTTPDTDQGWVYATVTTAGQVTSAGRIASCMGCHEAADHERLFGVPRSTR